MAPFRLLICGLALGLLGAPAVAQAQSSGGVKVQVDAQQFNISRTEQRSSGEYPDWINREDCVNDDLVNPGAGTSIDITPNLGETGSRLGFEVWISQGTDCTSSEERGTNAINCWNVLKTVPRVNNETYRISPRAVLAERDEDKTSEAVCNKQVQWKTDFYFLLLDGDQVVGSSVWKGTQVDTAAPASPSEVGANGGEDIVFLNWTVPTNDEDSDTQGYTFFCVPTGGSSGSGQGGSAGVVDPGGQGGQGGAPAAPSNLACATTELIPGELPPLNRRCGFATGRGVRNGQTSQQGDNDAALVLIENGQTYAVGISAADQVGNEGVLSQVVCATPEEVTSFFEQYKADGGRGGGGICALTPGPVRSHHLAWLFLMVIAAATWRRARGGAL